MLSTLHGGWRGTARIHHATVSRALLPHDVEDPAGEVEGLRVNISRALLLHNVEDPAGEVEGLRVNISHALLPHNLEYPAEVEVQRDQINALDK